MKGNYFLETSGEKFQDVRASGICLRCYSNKHRAAMCKLFTRPTPTLCKKCHYLFHPTGFCPNYTSENRSRGPSANRSLSKTRKWPSKQSGPRLPVTTSQATSFDPIIEEWEGENDFHYFDLPILVSDSESESDNDSDSEVITVPTFTASSATKAKSAARAKYRFPSKDPSDNVVKDTRTDEEKVSGILRLWCQLLTDDEKKSLELNRGTRLESYHSIAVRITYTQKYHRLRDKVLQNNR